MVEDRGKSFIKGAMILSAAGITAKIMGFGYRVILSRVIGDEGIGLYQMAYPIYTTLLVISRSGIPISLAKMISDRIARNQRLEAFKIFRLGRLLSITVGLFFSISMALLARPIVNLLNWDPRAYYAVLALSPAIFFVSIMASYRGFFQGLQDMVPTAVSQVIEQLVRMITMIGLVLMLVPLGLGYAAAGATFGAVTGSIAGLLVLIYIYYKRKQDIWDYVNTGNLDTIDSWKIIREYLALGIPITFGALVQPLMNLVDAVIVPQRLQVAGFAISRASQLYGRLSGMAMVLVNFPTIITVSLAASLVPAISDAFARQDSQLIKRRTETALRLTILVGLPSSVGLFVLARPLTTVIFKNQGAAIPLRFVAWGVLFITLQQTTSAILQGIGKTTIPARNLFIGALINALINYTLTAMPVFGIRGAAIGTATGFGVAAFLNIIHVRGYTGFSFSLKTLILKPVMAAGIMGGFVFLGFPLLRDLYYTLVPYNYILATFSIVLLAVVLYFFTLLFLKEIYYSDLRLIPGVGPRLARVLKKIGLVGDK